MDYVAELRRTVADAATRWARADEARAARRPAPGKWSAKEIVGHLVDSASNNHQRFVRAQLQDDLVFSGYAQDDWVRLQAYQTAPWHGLLSLWCEYNLHIARVMEATPAEVRTRERRRHNLHQIAWQTVDERAPVTLDFFMRDYVAHLHHHVRQIEELLQ
jgi:hypothetical protein